MANQVKATDTLLFRVGPGKDGTVIRPIPTGEVLILRSGTATVDGYDWYRLTDAHGVGGWAAVNWLAPVTAAPPVVAPPPAPTGSKRFGVNTVGPGAFNELLGMIQRLHDAGKPLALVVVINQPDLVATIKRLSPSTFVVYRSTDMPTGVVVTGNLIADYAAGKQFFADHWPKLAQGVGADAYSFCNEWLSYDNETILAGGCAAYCAIMDAAHDIGVKVTFGDLNSGHPLPTIEGAMTAMLNQGEAQGHILNVHWYTASGTTDPNVGGDGRGLRALGWLKGRPNLRMIYGEYGPTDNNARYPGDAAFLQMNQQIAPLIPAQCIGWAYFADAPSESWKQSDCRSGYAEIEAWLVQPASPLPVGAGTILPLPYRSQWDRDSVATRNVNCGPTCAAMVINYFTTNQPTINELASKTALANGAKGLSCSQLVALLSQYGVAASNPRLMTFAPIAAFLDQGKPVIALVHEGDLPSRQDSYTGGHFVIIVGYSGTDCLIQDPDHWLTGRATGNHLKLPQAQMMKAILDSESPGDCVVCIGSATPQEWIGGIVDMAHRDVFPTAYLSTLRAIIHKSSEGTLQADGKMFADPLYAQRRQIALDAGLRWGSYHFITGELSATDQADFYLTTVKPVIGEEMAVDFERNPDTAGTTAALAQVIEFAQRVHDQTNRWPMVYCNPGEITPTMDIGVLAQCKLWLADWNATISVPRQFVNGVTLWQHGPKYVDGVFALDGNRYFGNYNQFVNQWGSDNGKS